MSSAGSQQSGEAETLPTTAEMKAQLDQVSEVRIFGSCNLFATAYPSVQIHSIQTIPKLLENLSSAIGVLSQGQEEGQGDKWEEHLRGYGAQYLGRLNVR